ncbi:hypothetical protein L1987_01712 [Smallanthus sonchifolius]|uniref:Uncharacterized protein n=1 Tax=Smallanthus sonchifolius TaxID=185202 RepID=A0ACB9K5T5_9ASTR|nr:hypothetical protein L1987_01712 [Smallanthus sonchifolius]
MSLSRRSHRDNFGSPFTRVNNRMYSNQVLLKHRRIQERRRVEYHQSNKHLSHDIFGINKASSFVNLGDNFFPNHIKELYSSFNFNEITSTITLTLYNQVWCWSFEKFCELLHVPYYGSRTFDTSHDITNLKIIPRDVIISTICRSSTHPSNTRDDMLDLLHERIVWNHILLHNLFMQEENQEEVLTVIAYVLYFFKTHTPCNLGYIMVKRMVNLPATFEKLLPFGILLTNLFKNIQIELGPPKVPTLKTLSLNSIIGELHLPFPLSSMLSSMDVKKHFEELLKVPCSSNGEAPKEDNKRWLLRMRIKLLLTDKRNIQGC